MGPGSGPRGGSTLSGQKGPTMKAGQGPLWPFADHRTQEEAKITAFKKSAGPIKPSNQMKEFGRPLGTGQATSGAGVGSQCLFNRDMDQVKLVQKEETVKAPAGGRRKLR